MVSTDGPGSTNVPPYNSQDFISNEYAAKISHDLGNDFHSNGYYGAQSGRPASVPAGIAPDTSLPNHTHVNQPVGIQINNLGQNHQNIDPNAFVPNGWGPYRCLGTASGAALGWIVASGPGAVAGAAIGGSLGAVRDQTGVDVNQVYQRLDPAIQGMVVSRFISQTFSH